MADRLWAPWRLDYITAEKQGRCFLCDATTSAREEDSLLVWRNDRVIVVLNRFPYNNGHLLVAPVRHLPDLCGLDDKTLTDLMHTVDRMMELLKRVAGPNGFNVGINLGTAAGAGLAEHLHIHVVPRWAGDTNFMPVLADTKVIPQALETLRQQLRTALNEGA